MGATEPPGGRGTFRDAILAQLNALKKKGEAMNPPEEEEQQQLHGVGSSRGTTLPQLHRYPSLGFGGGPISPNTRRLPPMFAKHRQNAAQIRGVCIDLNDTLLQLNADFARGGSNIKSMNQAPLPGGVQSLLQERARRALLSKRQKEYTGRSPTGNRDSVNEMSEMGQEIEDIRRARIAAADEGLSDEQSVSDYAGEPHVPRFVPGSTLREALEAMEEPLRKINESIAAMSTIDERDAGNPWWNSAMLTRDMKASGIRANYHARRLLTWIQRARERFLVEAVTTNEQSEHCRADMLYLREQEALFMQRIDSSQKMQAEAASEMAVLQEAIREANHVKSELQQKLVAAAKEEALLPSDSDDALRAEFLLLLERVVWPAALQSDVDRIRAWVQENPMPLDV
ncbi:uncharacterized protein TM35_000391110 [Trypanosoma theileri]|uniref:Uncharacterized protein n=1 Tax=Trypanosoma theileri TaxID=67003 RepID=A0A1X0NJU7_9TRYP|nr:uncharacterized protein TM35_000391110 [Trypanosoma theileri]ORC84937.1 hypothetical protein TM35_000391110 [Trypanosoma theileri]